MTSQDIIEEAIKDYSEQLASTTDVGGRVLSVYLNKHSEDLSFHIHQYAEMKARKEKPE